MKYSTFLFITVIVLAFISCKKQPEPVNENFIPVNKCQSFNRDNKIITCCLDSVIQDTRCPISAFCISEGMAVARFSVNLQNAGHIITLATTNFPPYSKDTTIAGFKIEFIKILPQRELAKPVNYKDYVAEVNITKL